MVARAPRYLLVAAALFATVGHSHDLDGGVSMDATVETSSGATMRLSTLWHKPTVVFYEDRDSTPLNQHVKDALTLHLKERRAGDAVTVAPVANVAAFDWFPARTFALAAVKESEKKNNVTIYLDFKGALTQPPWSLPSKTSTVLLFAPGGDVAFKATGKLSVAQVQALFAALDGLTLAP
jgi:hypothetical protein